MRLTIVPGTSPELADDGREPVQLTGADGRTYGLGAEPLGAGAQAEVWPATRDDGTPVAIKLAYVHSAAQVAVRQEADLLAALGGAGLEGVVPCLDRVSWEGRDGFVLPLYPRDVEAYVAERIAASQGTAIEAVLDVVARLARSLGALHAVELPEMGGRVVHRDLKPENVLVEADGTLRLADFGGSLVVDALGSMDLGVFGSPLWAPFDQMLPGLPEPNPTWDTYACCVMLFWWITGGRPAYQADPTPMLTPAGQAIWGALTAFGAAETPKERLASCSALFAAREGTRAADLVNVRGHGAIQAEDRAALDAGVRRLADPERYGDALGSASRSLADLLARGLSPLSHPSPPNRFWSAAELAEEIEAVAGALARARAERVAEQEREGLRAEVRRLADQQRTDRARARRWLRPAPLLALAGLGGLTLFVPASLAGWWFLRGEPEPVEEEAPIGVSIPGGSFVAGDVRGDGEADEQPVRTVEIGPFRMHRTEVSNAMYQECVTRGVCTSLATVDEKLRGPTQPAAGVTWQQAVTFCAWAGGRLPTEEEWEKAATASAASITAAEKQRWPWGGAEPDCTRANYAACGLDKTLPVDSLPYGADTWGVVHLVGNVWEWTSSVYTVVRRELFRRTTIEHRVLRGGAWNSGPSYMRPTYRRHADPDRVSDVHGFRCVFDG